MNLWRLEWLRLTRTGRILILLGVFLLFGVTGPLTARYLSTILSKSGGGRLKVTVPPPTPADGITQFLGNAQFIGLLTILAISVMALGLETKPGIAVFFQTRVRRGIDLLLPRYVTVTAAAVVSYSIGVALAYALTAVLIGRLPVAAVLAGLAYLALYIAFAIAVAALSSTFLHNTMGATCAAFGGLVGMALVGSVKVVGEWLPSGLAGSLDGIIRGGAAVSYLRAAAVTVVLIVVLLAGAVRRLSPGGGRRGGGGRTTARR